MPSCSAATTAVVRPPLASDPFTRAAATVSITARPDRSGGLYAPIAQRLAGRGLVGPVRSVPPRRIAWCRRNLADVPRLLLQPELGWGRPRRGVREQNACLV